VFGRDQARKHLNASSLDGKIVESSSKGLPTILNNTHPPPLGTIVGAEFLEPDHTMGNAVGGPVQCFGREIIQGQHGGFAARKVVLESQQLAPIAQRTLGEEANLRETVDHDASWLHSLHCFRNHLDRLAQLKVRGVQQALLPVRIEEGICRLQLKDLNEIIQIPTMRRRAFQEFLLRFRQRDVKRSLFRSHAFHQKSYCNGGLTRSRMPFEEEQASARETA
jgi:hypothetical protein